MNYSPMNIRITSLSIFTETEQFTSVGVIYRCSAPEMFRTGG
jgi:hypothetical protein